MSAARMAMNGIVRAAHEVEPWVERFARVGYFAIGAVYMIAGGLTAAAALRNRTGTTDRDEALGFILGQPFGKAILIVMAIGLAGYSLWRITSGIVDSDRRGRDAKGLAIRAAAIVSGVIHAGLTAQIIRMVSGGGGGRGGDDASAEQSSARVLELPFGGALLITAGAVIAIIGIYQLVRAWNAKLSKRLRLSSLTPKTREAVIAVSRFGIASRGVVFAIIGASVITAAVRYDPKAVDGLAGAFAELAQQPFGQVLLAVVAIGLVAYGVYAVVNGLYRQIATR